MGQAVQSLKLHAPLEEYIRYFERLSVRSVRLVEKISEPQLEFIDPIFTSRGHDEFENTMVHILNRFEQPKIKVTDYAWGRDGTTAFLRWRFEHIYKGQKEIIPGMSEISFSHNDLVISHVNYWDIGSSVLPKHGFLNWVKKQIQTKL